MLPTTSLTLIRTFLCTHFDDGRSFLNAELSVECGTPRHKAATVYASLMICVYPGDVLFE